MSLEPETDHAVAIPKELRDQLAQFQKHLWRIKVLEAVLAGFCGLILSFLLVFILDRLIPTPALARLSILIGGTSLFAIFAPLWIRRWVYGHKREEQLARLIARKFPKLGDRLLGVVELQDQDERRASLSPELREAAMAHVARQAAKRDMSEALPISRHRKLALAVIGGAALMVAGFALSPKAGLNSLKRWLMPLSETERYTFTQLDFSEIPNPYIVPYGEPFTLPVPLAPDTDQSPSLATARYGQQDWLETPLTGNRYLFEFTGQQTPKIVTVKAGDDIHRLKVEPVIRPELTGLKADISLPDYLELADRTLDIRTGVLTALEGSEVTLAGTFTRPLNRAQGKLSYLEDPDTDVPPPNGRELTFTFEGETMTSLPIPIINHRAEIPLTWVDEKGLSGASRFLLRLEASEDQKPSAYIQGIDRQVVILAEETLEFEVLCEDDFGLREIGIAWEGNFTKPTKDSPASGEMILKKGTPSSSRLSEMALFSPKTHNIEPKRLRIRAYAEDYKPGRGRLYSDPLVVYILTPDEHAQMLKNKFDRLIGELEDTARQEQNQLDQNQRLGQQKDEELQNEENQQKLAESEKLENENAKKMAELAKKMEKLFQDAARNKDLDPKAMKQMAEALKNMQDLAQEDLPKVGEKLNDAQDQKNTAEKTKKDLKDAIEEQKKALEKMKETIEQANEANQNFEASTFVNRLKRAASEEDQIAANLISAVNSESQEDIAPLLGSNPDQRTMDPIHTRLLGQLDTQQKRINSDVRWIQEDLSHFYARTRKPEHQKLLSEMQESQIDVGLERLREKIAANHSFRAIHGSKVWAAKMRDWATKLKGDQNDGQGGGGAGGAGNKEEQDFEFMLKVMRMVQAEQDIRSRTRSLEQLQRALKLKTNPSK